jgi:predicted SprT family Zn-dependent metalloprotease
MERQQTTLSDARFQRVSLRATDVAETSPVSDSSVGKREPQTRDELLERSEAYAGTVDIDVNLSTVEWEVSERAKRRAGACYFSSATESITIRLTWAAYQEYGWDEFTDVIRHELVHAWEFQQSGESSHSWRFREKADDVDASRHCRSFTDARLVLRCTDEECDWTTERHRASKAVTMPEERRCGACRSQYVVEHVESGENWTSTGEYEQARERIGDQW